MPRPGSWLLLKSPRTLLQLLPFSKDVEVTACQGEIKGAVLRGSCIRSPLSRVLHYLENGLRLEHLQLGAWLLHLRLLGKQATGRKNAKQIYAATSMLTALSCRWDARANAFRIKPNLRKPKHNKHSQVPTLRYSALRWCGCSCAASS